MFKYLGLAKNKKKKKARRRWNWCRSRLRFFFFFFFFFHTMYVVNFLDSNIRPDPDSVFNKIESVLSNLKKNTEFIVLFCRGVVRHRHIIFVILFYQ